MNYTIIPKTIVSFQTGNNKPADIYVWATIKYCSNYNTDISHVTEEKLSQLTGLDVRTIRRSIKRLKEAQCLVVECSIIKDVDRGFIKRNRYQLPWVRKNYFFLDNKFFEQKYPAKIAGFLLLLKAKCLNKTNTVLWNISRIATELGLSRNTTAALMKECQKLELVTPIKDGYEITTNDFINNPIASSYAGIYQEICEFCEKKGVSAPKWDKLAIGILSAKFGYTNRVSVSEPISLTYQLGTHFKNLPMQVSIPYFLKAFGFYELYQKAKKEQQELHEQRKNSKGFEF